MKKISELGKNEGVSFSWVGLPEDDNRREKMRKSFSNRYMETSRFSRLIGKLDPTGKFGVKRCKECGTKRRHIGFASIWNTEVEDPTSIEVAVWGCPLGH